MEKVCKHCGETKPLELFQRHPRSAHGRTNKCKACACETEKLRYAKDKETIRQHRNAYYAANKDAIRGRVNAHYKRNKSAIRDKTNAQYAANKIGLREKIYAWRRANMDKHKASARKWKAKNQERQNAYERARYARSDVMRTGAAERCRRYQVSKRNATPAWADVKAMRVLYAKAKEWQNITGVEWHVDHIVPIKNDMVCGLHTWDNLQLLTSDINLSKYNRVWPDMP